ncbi:bifunctional 5,10-methylenetetrahydrofolate dehydrogenase/5,10-methenyltetrahydrofolate cyclohydrolase [Candidatus Daviesbacteria bacterium]|nr:bifunctional 5,10-methylenetetrahydrofolate dehydrogenase/5,10-methenyltetrahydrofolate cyclohydrolase [Candidatus Daviesbacteria bacterium]
MSNIIDGKKIAEVREKKLKEKIERLEFKPKVVSILIGDDPPSVLYTQIKQKKAEELGITFEAIKLPEDVSFYQISQLIISLNEDKSVDGIMMQLPLPKNFLASHKTSELLELIKKEKDVDGLTQDSPFLTAAVEAVLTILEEEKIEVKAKYVVMVGASELIGLPIANELKKRGAMVKICDSQTPDIKVFTEKADILVSATGTPHLIKGDLVKTGVVVIDVGVMVISESVSEAPGSAVETSDGSKIGKAGRSVNTDNTDHTDTTVLGDVDFESVAPKAFKITPVPGGVGPITVVSLMENVVKSAERRH